MMKRRPERRRTCLLQKWWRGAVHSLPFAYPCYFLLFHGILCKEKRVRTVQSGSPRLKKGGSYSTGAEFAPTCIEFVWRDLCRESVLILTSSNQNRLLERWRHKGEPSERKKNPKTRIPTYRTRLFFRLWLAAATVSHLWLDANTLRNWNWSTGKWRSANSQEVSRHTRPFALRRRARNKRKSHNFEEGLNECYYQITCYKGCCGEIESVDVEVSRGKTSSLCGWFVVSWAELMH